MEDLFADVLLFDYAKQKMVKKNELSEESKKIYQELSNAHLKMINERYKHLFLKK